MRKLWPALLILGAAVPLAPATAAPLAGTAVDDTRAAPPAAAEAAPAAKPGKPGKRRAPKSGDGKRADTVEVHGRVFARATATREETVVGAPWQSELTLASARLSVDYRWKHRLRAKVSIEAASGNIRDALIELPLADGLRLRAGRMKLPIGAVEAASAWTLPTIDRGLVADALADGLGATGRRSLVELRWRGAAAWKPTLTVAAAQGVRTAGGEQPGLVADGGGVTIVARAAATPCPSYTVAVSAASRVVNYGSATARFWNATLEAEADLAAIGAGLRVWGDATVGTGHYAAAVLGQPSRRFAALEVIAGYRLGGRKAGARYLEPFAGAGWLNPILDRARDDASEVVGGVGGGRWKRWRGQLQVGYQNARALRPALLLGTSDVNDRLRVDVQLGAAF
ncbi:MAG: hypothetical protein R3B06_09380 [Kofleriaceae bacterium]